MKYTTKTTFPPSNGSLKPTIPISRRLIWNILSPLSWETRGSSPANIFDRITYQVQWSRLVTLIDHDVFSSSEIPHVKSLLRNSPHYILPNPPWTSEPSYLIILIFTCFKSWGLPAIFLYLKYFSRGLKWRTELRDLNNIFILAPCL